MASFNSNRGRRNFGKFSGTTNQTVQTTVADYVPHWAVVMENGEVSRMNPRMANVISIDERQSATASTLVGGMEFDTIDMTNGSCLTIHDIFNAVTSLVPQGVDAEVWSKGSNGARGDANRFDEGTDQLSMTLFHRIYIDAVITSDGKVVGSGAIKKYGNVFFSVRVMCDQNWCESAVITNSYKEFIEAVKNAI